MAIANYVTLKSAVADWAERSDLTTQIPDFIRAAHDTITRELVITSDLTLDSATETLPADCREIVTLWAIERATGPLQQASQADMERVGSYSGYKMAPRYYRQSGTTLYLAPTPSDPFVGRVVYRLSRTPFSADADTNTALTRYPFLYLHGALAELMAYLRDRDGEATYSGKFKAGLVDAIRAETAQAAQGAMLQTRSTVTV
jgi:hypothetical protein